MLGIYLLVCMAVYFLIELKAYSLVKGGVSSVELSAEPRTYEICRRVAILHIVSDIVAFLGYAGCAWPYLFIKEVYVAAYIVDLVIFGLPLIVIAFLCYRKLQDTQGSVRISTDEIEYKRRKPFTVKVSDIRKINYLGWGSYVIHVKEKGKKSLRTHLFGVYKQKEIHSLMKQLRDSCAKTAGRDRTLGHKLNSRRFLICLEKALQITVVLVLIYTSYCCIDYDFVRKDYTARYNALNADAGQTENAWPHYVQAAADCVELEEELQKLIETNVESSPLDFTDIQKDELKNWFSKNSASWESLKKAASIDYCNAAYKQISLMSSKGRRDFSNPSDNGYAQIRDLYGNINAGRRAKVWDMNWFDLFGMQLTSSRHFIHGKSYMDQLNGYGMLRKSVGLLSVQHSYTLEDLQKVRTLLKKQFPASVPLLNIEGEMLILSGSFNDMINFKKIPVQSPLNPLFLMLGSSTGTEIHVRNRHTAILEQVRNGVEYKHEEFSIFGFPIMRKMLFSMLEGSTVKLYQNSQKANTDLLAAYVLLDLEEYRLSKSRYPADVSQLKEAGFHGELPDDIDSGGKIIYRNDGQRAILYAVGYNAIDDGGYFDPRGSGDKRDDIVYWQRDVNNK